MPSEPDAKHVERFPLVPVGARPDSRDRGNDGVLLVDPDLHPHIPLVLERVEVVDDLKPLLGRVPVNGSNVDHHCERQRRIRLEGPAHVH